MESVAMMCYQSESRTSGTSDAPKNSNVPALAVVSVLIWFRALF